MAVEIERKFLVTGDGWREDADPGRRIRQVYLAHSTSHSVRVRVVDDSQAWLTIKSGYRGISRDEFEYEVPVGDAVEMFKLRLSGIIDKVRYRVPIDELIWEVDVFEGDNAGLTVAEIELSNEAEQPPLPAWVGAEVTAETRYQNSVLAATPYATWKLSE